MPKQFSRAKAQSRKETQRRKAEFLQPFLPLRLPLRLCAFARESFSKMAHKARARVCRGELSQPLNQRAVLQQALTALVSPSRSSADPDHEQSSEFRQTEGRQRSSFRY